MKLGVYDPKTEVYREYLADGKSLGEPKAFPWKPREKKSETATKANTPPTEPVPEPEPVDPGWTPYAVGGTVAGLLLVLVFMTQMRGG